MSDKSQANKNAEHINTARLSQEKTSENRELFKRALTEAVEQKFNREKESIDITEKIQPSKRHKIQMNRIFRERVGGSFLSFPEVDNVYERLRSKLVVKFKINELRDRRKANKRQK